MQQTFDRIVTHLRKQGCRCVDGFESCKYRNNVGQKCAAGCLIENDEYKPKMEGRCIQTLINECYKFRNITKENLDLVKALQSVHDCEDVDKWEHYFKKVAEKFGVNYDHKR